MAEAVAAAELVRAKEWVYSGAEGGDVALAAAHDAALEAMALSRGLGWDATAKQWTYGSAESCSAVPDTAETQTELRWWDAEKKRCVAGNVDSVQWCKDNGNLDWIPDPASGIARCEVTTDYCLSKGMHYSDGDCRVDFGMWLLEMFVGVTISRGIRWVLENPDLALEGAVKLALAGAELAYSTWASPLLDIIASGKLEELPGAVLEMVLKNYKAAINVVGNVSAGAFDLVESLANTIDSVCPSVVCGPLKAIIPIQFTWKLARFANEWTFKGLDMGMGYLIEGADVVFDALESVLPIGKAMDAMRITPVFSGAVGLTRDVAGKAIREVGPIIGDVYELLQIADVMRGWGTGIKTMNKGFTDATRAVYKSLFHQDASMMRDLAQNGLDKVALGFTSLGEVTRITDTANKAVDPATYAPVAGAFTTSATVVSDAAKTVGGALVGAAGTVAGALGSVGSAITSVFGGGSSRASGIRHTGLAAECLCHVPWWDKVSGWDVDHCRGATQASVDATSAHVNRSRPGEMTDAHWMRKACRVGLERRLQTAGSYDSYDVDYWSLYTNGCMHTVAREFKNATAQIGHQATSYVCRENMKVGATVSQATLDCGKRAMASGEVASWEEAAAMCALDVTATDFSRNVVPPTIQEGEFVTSAARRAQLVKDPRNAWLACQQWSDPLPDAQLPFTASDAKVYNELTLAQAACLRAPDCSGVTQVGDKFLLRRDATPTPLLGATSWLRTYDKCMANAAGVTDPTVEWEGPHSNAKPMGGVMLQTQVYSDLNAARAAAAVTPVCTAIVQDDRNSFRLVQGGNGVLQYRANFTTWRRRAV
jgi:hypothetical protein